MGTISDGLKFSRILGHVDIQSDASKLTKQDFIY